MKDTKKIRWRLLAIVLVLVLILLPSVILTGCLDPGTETGSNSSGSGAILGTPTNVTATATSSSSITVHWSAVSGATGYYVYRYTSSFSYDSYKQSEVSTTSFTDYGLSEDTTYYYRVSAYNDAGRSGESAVASAKTLPPVPAIPTGVTASAESSSSIKVSWYYVSWATGYYVYRSTSASGTYTKIGNTSSNSYTDTPLPTKTTCYYKVSAYNSTGESSQSSYVQATTW